MAIDALLITVANHRTETVHPGDLLGVFLYSSYEYSYVSHPVFPANFKANYSTSYEPFFPRIQVQQKKG